MYPAFLKLDGRPVLIVGAGPVAAGKLEGLLAAGAKVTVVAPDIRPEFERAGVTRRRRAFEPHDLDGMWWVVAAAPSEVNEQVVAAAERQRVSRRRGAARGCDDRDFHQRPRAGAGGVDARSAGRVAARGPWRVD